MDPGNTLRQARRRAGLSQRELAERTGVPQSTVARIESGAADPRTRTLDRLLRACGEQLEATPRLSEGVDRSLIREYLKLTPRERVEANTNWVRAVQRLRRGVRR